MDDLKIDLTDVARQKLIEFLESEEPGQAIRLAVEGRGPRGFNYQLETVDEAENRDSHVVLEYDGLRLLVDPASVELLGGVTIDFVQRGFESGFHFDNPNGLWNDPIANAVQQVLDQQINPSVAGHGGFVTLLGVEGSTAYIALGGGCQGCGMADVTLKQGIEVAIIDAVEEIDRVLDSTDHAAGENPYFEPSKSGDSPFA